MTKDFDPAKSGRVISAYQSTYPDPLVVRAGDVLEIGHPDNEWSGWVWCTNPRGKSGWVPEIYIERSGNKGTARKDYTTRELSVHSGERVLIHQMESGWYWATNKSGQSGWVPARNIEILPDE